MTYSNKSLEELRADIERAKAIEASRSAQWMENDAAKQALKKINRLEDCMYYYARNIIDTQKRNGELAEEVAMLELRNNGLRADLAASTTAKKAGEQVVLELMRKIEVLEKSNKLQKEKMQQDKIKAKKAADPHLNSSAGLTPRPSISRLSRTPSVPQIVFTPLSASSPIEKTLYMSALADSSAIFPELSETPLCRPKSRRSGSLTRGIMKAVRRSFSSEPRATKLDTTLEVEQDAKKKKKKVLFDT